MERNFLIDCEDEDMEVQQAGIVIDYMIEYISIANSKISFKYVVYFAILIPYLLPYLIPPPSYNRSKNFLHRLLYLKAVKSPK